MPSEQRPWAPPAPSTPERFDEFAADSARDENVIRALRAEVVAARRVRRADALMLADAIERTEQLTRQDLTFRVGSIVQHYSKARVGAALQRRRPAGAFVPEPYPTTLEEQYSRWYVLERRRRLQSPTRWAADSVALVIVGTTGVEATVASLDVQRQLGDVHVVIDHGKDLADAAAELAVTERPPRWLMVLNAGDLLTYDALASLTSAANGADWVYADQDRYESSGRRVQPTLKSKDPGAFSALGRFVAGECAIFRRSALSRVNAASGSAWLHDASLRLVEAGSAAVHVPTVLLSRPLDAPSYFDDRDLAGASERALVRRRWGGRAVAGRQAGTVSWRPTDPDPWPSVDVVIVNSDGIDHLRSCLLAFEGPGSYPGASVTIVDSGSSDPATIDFLAATPHRVVRVESDSPGPRLVNAGAADSSSDYVLVLSARCQTPSSAWLGDLVRVAELPGVGVVGATLVDPNGVITNAGVAVTTRPCALRSPDTYPFDDPMLFTTRDVTSVSAACQLVRRDLWEQLGGLDASFVGDGANVDLSLRARALGWRTVVLDTTVTHYEDERAATAVDDAALDYRWGLSAGFVDAHATPLIDYAGDAQMILLDSD